MTRTSDACHLLLWHIVLPFEIAAHRQALLWDNTLNRRHNHLLPHVRLQLLQVTLDVRRRNDKNERVIILHHLVDVAGEIDSLHIEVNSCQISRIMVHALEILNTIITAHIPSYLFFMVHNNLSNGCSPTTATQNCHSTTRLKLHNLFY